MFFLYIVIGPFGIMEGFHITLIALTTSVVIVCSVYLLCTIDLYSEVMARNSYPLLYNYDYFVTVVRIEMFRPYQTFKGGVISDD